MEKVIVKLENVTKKFNKNTIIKNINLEIYEGEFITFLGPSGCGKTTLLRLISGLEKVTDGKVYIENIDVTNIEAAKREVNTVFQNFALFPHMNVYDNIAFGLEMQKLPKDEIKRRVNETIKLVNLKGYEDRFPKELSGGQQQRVAISRGIVMKPKVLLLDESLCSLDLKLKRKMQIELKNIQKKLGITFIYVTHDQNEAITMSDRIAIINKGKIEQLGTPKEIYANPVDSFVADFIGESNIINGKIEKVFDDEVEIVTENELHFIVNNDNLVKNNLIKIMIRPENIKVSKNKLLNSYEGIIDDLIYMGDYSKLYVNINNFIFKIDVNDIDLYNKGDTVYVKFDKDDIVSLMR